MMPIVIRFAPMIQLNAEDARGVHPFYAFACDQTASNRFATVSHWMFLKKASMYCAAAAPKSIW